jgi:uncharacterized protein YegP (UPF0339 family)
MESMSTVEFFEDEGGEWRFRVKGGNGEIVAASEGYASESNARRGAETLFELLRPEVEPVVAAAEKQNAELPSEQHEQLLDALMAAAWCYLSAARDGNGFDYRMYPMAWPWAKTLWAPGTKAENLQKAKDYLETALGMYTRFGKTESDEGNK